jgi:hypothetical protein
MTRTAAISAALVALAVAGPTPADAGFKTPESLIQNLYAFYGDRSSELSSGFPRDPAIYRAFYSRELEQLALAAKPVQHDFFIQDWTWKSPLIVRTVRTSKDGLIDDLVFRPGSPEYLSVVFRNMDRHVYLMFELVRGADGWRIGDVIGKSGSYRNFLKSIQQ